MSSTPGKITRSRSRESLRHRLLRVLLLSVLVAPGVHAETVRYHLDAAGGVDDGARDGTAAAPFRTLAYALERAADDGIADLEVVLSAGSFEAPSSGVFVIVSAFERVVLRGTAGGTTIVGTACAPLFSWAPSPERGTAMFELADLTLAGGVSAIEIEAPAGLGATLSVDRVRFVEQEQLSLLVTVGEGGAAGVEIGASEFASAAGILVEALAGADATLAVSDCSFHSSPDLPIATATGVPSVGAIALHAANGGRLDAGLERNTFRDVPAAVAISADESFAVPGATVIVSVENSVVNGFATKRPFGVRNAFLLSLWPHHELDVRFVNNTIVGVEGAVVAQDNLDILGGLGELGVGASIPWTFANNVCHAIENPTEFAAEYDPHSESFVEAFPPPGVTVRGNVLEKSPLAASGTDGNIVAVDPGFVSLPELDFRLTATSPAVDHGALEYAEGSDVDIAGACRVASAECDGALYRVDAGAFERAGFCREEVRFVRGDCAMDGGMQLSDPITLFNFLFLGSAAPVCHDACDADDDGATSLTDGILVLTYLFLGGPEPRSPGARPGYDPTCDDLPCFAAE